MNKLHEVNYGEVRGKNRTERYLREMEKLSDGLNVARKREKSGIRDDSGLQTRIHSGIFGREH